MKFCPECKNAFNEDIEKCPNCKEILVDKLDEHQDIEFVELCDIEDPFKANLIIDVLEDNNIESYLYSEPVHIYPIPGEGIQFTVYVNKEKIDHAKSLLEDIERSENMEPLPDDEST
ncbi:MAG: DUF2007 domain-containing protein [Deltaproteobacteria bacterium]|nr:DUF2007 domain-containing protein [Deltaproteobacteria bacterium]